MGQKLLSDGHAQMMAYQSSVNRTVNGSAATTLPTQAVVALWDASVDWSGGGWHTNVSLKKLFAISGYYNGPWVCVQNLSSGGTCDQEW